ncbi:hypothetical protein L682_07165 [Aquipseudomonas alcaligenes OT 69]|nr:hypothetical protein L682_07165 [Pseudomonas alcaligenes OT 69]
MEIINIQVQRCSRISAFLKQTLDELSITPFIACLDVLADGLSRQLEQFITCGNEPTTRKQP